MNRRNGHTDFLCSCYDAQVCFHRATNSLHALYLPLENPPPNAPTRTATAASSSSVSEQDGLLGSTAEQVEPWQLRIVPADIHGRLASPSSQARTTKPMSAIKQRAVTKIKALLSWYDQEPHKHSQERRTWQDFNPYGVWEVAPATLSSLHPGMMVEVQWRLHMRQPFGWWLSQILEIERNPQGSISAIVFLNHQFEQGERWHTVIMPLIATVRCLLFV